MDYRTYEVSEALSPLVKCFWSLEAPATDTAEKQRIVPDGCMELIFHYGDLYYQYREDGGVFLQPRAFVFGQITSALEIAASGKSGILAARFHPEGFDPLATIPLREMENTAVSLEILFGENGLQLEHRYLTPPTTPNGSKSSRASCWNACRAAKPLIAYPSPVLKRCCSSKARFPSMPCPIK